MTYTLYAFNHPENSRCHKVMVAAKIAGLDVSYSPASMSPTPEWKASFHPSGGSPVLVTPEGNVFETNSCLRFVARSDKNGKLYGKNVIENSLVDSWLDFSLSELDIYGAHVVNAVLFEGKMPTDWLESIESTLSGLEARLEGKTFLVGDSLTIADICIAYVLQIPYRLSTHGDYLVTKFPNIWRMYSAVMALPESVEVLAHFGAAPFPAKKE